MSDLTEKLNAVEKAICDLHSGKRVTSVSYGDTRVQYAEVDLEALRKLRAQIKSSIKTESPRQVIFSTSKGLR